MPPLSGLTELPNRMDTTVGSTLQIAAIAVRREERITVARFASPKVVAALAVMLAQNG